MIQEFLEAILNPLSAVLNFLFLGGTLSFLGDFAIAPFGFPPLVLWLLGAGIFFTFKLGFINFRLFKHGIDCVRGKYSSKDDPGSVTHFQALSTAVSATVGLGNIGGVAIAVTLGGPGAVIWMMIAAFFGMSTKFAEVTLGQKYRHINHEGEAYGGPFLYLKEGLKEIGKAKLGAILSVIFAIMCITGGLGSILFQSNQSISLLTNSFSFFNGQEVLLSIIIATLAGVVIMGGIKRIALFAEMVVPFMAIIYVTACIVVIAVNAENLGSAISLMFSDAFTGAAVGGGIVGAILNGVKRSAFSNEAGMGTAPIAHATAKTKEPVREGAVSLLEPFLDTIIICFMTGIVVTITGTYIGADLNSGGVLITSRSFATVIEWFPKVLSVATLLFAFSTMITYCYYGEQAWQFIKGHKHLKLIHGVFIFFIFIGGVISLETVISLADTLFLLMAIPNIFGMYFLTGILTKETKSYIARLKAGEFKKH
ncbi:alanine glycine permease [Candidatus Marinamargulisbacteria bacterium SCGC AAA071-K20]|nr:alanine glycine permease [Candidatus Marinamargulisbacteria bacterium SCGC AAA071-K20]